MTLLLNLLAGIGIFALTLVGISVFVFLLINAMSRSIESTYDENGKEP